MGLETATYIEDLVATNPVGATDFASQGDDHLRLLKAVLKAQFPSLGQAAVSLTAAQINDAARKGAANAFTGNNTHAGTETFNGAVALNDPVTGDASATLTMAALATFNYTYTAFGTTGYIRTDNAGWMTLQCGVNGYLFRNNGNTATIATLTNAGNLTLAAPSSGTTFTITNDQLVSDALKFINGSTRTWLMGPGSGTGADDFALLYDSTRGATVLRASNAGNLTASAPSSGVTLSIGGVTNGTQVQVSDGTITSVLATTLGTKAAWGVTSNHGLSLYTNSTERVAISAAGDVTINAPSSGIALTVTGLAGAPTASFEASGRATVQISSDSSTGYVGTSTDDDFVLIRNNVGKITVGDGVQLGSPTGGDKGADTLNTAGAIYRNNVLVESLPAVTSTSTTLAKGQAHYITGNATLPALAAGEWVAIINNSGSPITISENSGDTTYWSTGAVSVATVTVPARGRILAEGVGSTTVYISGDVSGYS